MTNNSDQTILVIEDDQMTREVVQRHLERAGFNVVTANDGKAGLQAVFDVNPNLVLLDINMPFMDGFTVCERVRELSSVPIIMLTAHSEPEEIVKGLELGADDYIPKPFNKDVLIARTKANLRRSSAQANNETTASNHPKDAYADNRLIVNFETRKVTVNSELIRLSPTEFKLLEMLIEATPRVLPYRIILENVWGFEYIDDINYLRVYIWHLRNKIEIDPKEPQYVVNELGVGYRFESQL